MFIGHYGPGAAAAHRRLKLWHCFVAVQFLDILWAPFVLAGVEKVRVVPGFTEASALDLYHMPYTHSLPAALFWSVCAALVYRAVRKSAGWTGAGLIGALVFSHWILDFVAHKPDLELWFGGPKVGLGLWERRDLSISLEMAIYLSGLAIYWARSTAKGFGGKLLPFALLLLGAAAGVFSAWGPPPGSARQVAIMAIVSYAVFAAFAALLDASREPR